MSREFRLRLRWYEHQLLLLLARSPRIARIVVEQVNPEADELDDALDCCDDPPFDVVHQLEALYHSPSAEDVREG